MRKRRRVPSGIDPDTGAKYSEAEGRRDKADERLERVHAIEKAQGPKRAGGDFSDRIRAISRRFSENLIGQPERAPKRFSRDLSAAIDQQHQRLMKRGMAAGGQSNRQSGAGEQTNQSRVLGGRGRGNRSSQVAPRQAAGVQPLHNSQTGGAQYAPRKGGTAGGKPVLARMAAPTRTPVPMPTIRPNDAPTSVAQMDPGRELVKRRLASHAKRRARPRRRLFQTIGG